MDNRAVKIIGISLVTCLVLFYIEQIMKTSYGVKIIAKIILFGIAGIMYYKHAGKISYLTTRPSKKSLVMALGVGVLSGLIVLLTYKILERYIDLVAIGIELQTKLLVTPANFILVALYITIVNSFLEEFFFRGLIGLGLYKIGYKKTAYWYSSILFGLYHIGIFMTWFSLPLIVLALIGLVAIGLFFNWMDFKENTIYPSWIAHAFADMGVMIIGFIMFGFL